MSRTAKDTPLRVQLLDNLKRGEVWHDHESLGKTVKRKRRYEYTFWKDDAAEVYEFRKYLNSEDYEYDVEETEPVPIYDPKATELDPVEYVPRKVIFTVTLRFVTKEYTQYCTDYKHYDAKLDIDTRDGKTPVCRPKIDGATFRQHYGGAVKEAHSRNVRNVALHNMAKAYNSGTPLEELEELEPEELQQHFDPRAWD